MHHCSTKWAIYLMSLKSLVETGNGPPTPTTSGSTTATTTDEVLADIDKVFKAWPTRAAGAARPAAPENGQT